MIDPHEFPLLFATTELPDAPVDARFVPTATAINDKRIASVYTVAFLAEECLMARFESGEWALLGGTLEPGETWRDALERELREEAGARPLTYTPFALLRCHSRATEPFRPHLPHPDYDCLLGYSEVEVIGAPLSPGGSERTMSVKRMPLEQAITAYCDAGQFWEAELYRLAASIRISAPQGPGESHISTSADRHPQRNSEEAAASTDACHTADRCPRATSTA